MSRTPNAEQLKAINHDGGVLLKAGAGSGKTFVLVEHICHLTAIWISEFKKRKDSNFEEFLRKKFSEVVMMTFTKKAAGEMNIRLNDRFIEQSQMEGDDRKFWEIANDVLPVLTVTTIDGFCRKLITGGFFPHLSPDAKIIFNAERTNQVKKIIDEWFLYSIQHIDQSILNIVLREKKSLLFAFTNIFNDPELRISWKKFDIDQIRPDSVKDILIQSFQINGLPESIEAFKRLDLDTESNRSAFEKMISIFQNSAPDLIDSVDKFKIYAELFSSIKKLDGERTQKKKTPQSLAAKNGLFELRSWINYWKDGLYDYHQHFESMVLPWMNLCLNIFNYIDSRLDPNQGMTFGDIEYFVSLGLENFEYRQKVQQTYQYFIVDEFQDTSSLQFSIIRELIGSDYKKLFCVGDPKQAIYGFRGGELTVFQNCMKLIPQVRSLVNNYRSLAEIINFNNSFFKTVLPLGPNFESHDPFTVDSEDQEVPYSEQPKNPGTVLIYSALLSRDLDQDGKFSNEEINRLEALALCHAIKAERQTTSNVCTVLYSRLRPSTELIRKLMDERIGFTAQYKIDLLDDPLMGIFLSLLKRNFDSNLTSRDRYPLFMVENYLRILGIKKSCDEKWLLDFDEDIKYWGLLNAFHKFIFKLNITNENSDINFGFIEIIARLHDQDPESVLTQISANKNDKFNLELRSGRESHMVQIMSAHASKGLEFDSVYIGGIYTNGKEQNDGSLFGDFPGSFKWHLDLSKKLTRKSPMYLLESEISKIKNFSESKRLFYVAFTRAKKKLSWVKFSFPEKSFSVPKNSWSIGLNLWMSDTDKNEIVKSVRFQELNLMDMGKGSIHPSLPLFFFDPTGIYQKGHSKEDLLISAEMSATKLNTLIDCPRKFYLSNTLKMPEPDSISGFSYSYDENVDNDLSHLKSSGERGSLLHLEISKGIKNNFYISKNIFDESTLKALEWTLELLKEKSNEFILVSESPLKFKFFNFMISGIPDLILFSKKDHTAQVWDFKTGGISKDKLNHYWSQLMIYAYALFELRRVDKSSLVDIVLCFVDKNELLQKKISFTDCVEYLYPLWKSQNEPWKINSDHCSQCSYGSICPR